MALDSSSQRKALKLVQPTPLALISVVAGGWAQR